MKNFSDNQKDTINIFNKSEDDATFCFYIKAFHKDDTSNFITIFDEGIQEISISDNIGDDSGGYGLGSVIASQATFKLLAGLEDVQTILNSSDYVIQVRGAFTTKDEDGNKIYDTNSSFAYGCFFVDKESISYDKLFVSFDAYDNMYYAFTDNSIGLSDVLISTINSVRYKGYTEETYKNLDSNTKRDVAGSAFLYGVSNQIKQAGFEFDYYTFLDTNVPSYACGDWLTSLEDIKKNTFKSDTATIRELLNYVGITATCNMRCSPDKTDTIFALPCYSLNYIDENEIQIESIDTEKCTNADINAQKPTGLCGYSLTYTPTSLDSEGNITEGDAITLDYINQQMQTSDKYNNIIFTLTASDYIANNILGAQSKFIIFLRERFISKKWWADHYMPFQIETPCYTYLEVGDVISAKIPRYYIDEDGDAQAVDVQVRSRIYSIQYSYSGGEVITTLSSSTKSDSSSSSISSSSVINIPSTPLFSTLGAGIVPSVTKQTNTKYYSLRGNAQWVLLHDIFLAQYDSHNLMSTYDELLDAYNNGKQLVCQYTNQSTYDISYYQLAKNTGTSFVFNRLIDNSTETIEDVTFQTYVCDKTKGWYEENAHKMLAASDMPSKLPNPYSLSFTGSTTVSYDGSSAVSVKIPNVNTFVATYGSTSWYDINEAYKAGKAIFVIEGEIGNDGAYYYQLVDADESGTNNTMFYFSALCAENCGSGIDQQVRYCRCAPTDTWRKGTRTIASQNNAKLTGTPTAPTATAGTSTTQIATTAFVANAVSSTAYTAGTGLTLSGNQFSHATGAGYNHIPTGGSSGQILKWSSNGTAQWASEYSYTLPIASADTLGGVKVGDGLSISSGVLSTKDIFVAVYGTTTYEEIQAAYNAGKALLAVKYVGTDFESRCYQLTEASSGGTQFVFECFKSDDCCSYRLYCHPTSSDIWEEDVSNTFASYQYVSQQKLPNPKALTFTGATTATYDGSSAVSVEIPTNVFVAEYGTTTYDEVKAAYDEGREIYVKQTVEDTSSNLTTICYYSLSDFQERTTGGEGEVSVTHYYFNFLYISSTRKERVQYSCTLTNEDEWSILSYNMATLEKDNSFQAPCVFNDDAGFKSYVWFQDVVSINQTPTQELHATNKKYVDDAIATAISGTAAYGGTVASEAELLAKDYKSGMYYVVAVASGSSWSGYENGDMFFAHTDKGTSPSLSDFDCVQTNITAMTDTEINNICTLD